jgi:hypothetical protein
MGKGGKIMKRAVVAALCAAFALAACGQSAEAPQAEEAPAAPAAMMDQVLAMAPEQQPVFAYQQLAAYQQTHPEVQPTCTAVRATESRGIIPANVDPASAYGPHAGALVFSVQCGALVSATRMDPNEHWLVVFAPGAAEPAIVHCAGGPGGDSRCPRVIPTVAAAPAPATP